MGACDNTDDNDYDDDNDMNGVYKTQGRRRRRRLCHCHHANRIIFKTHACIRLSFPLFTSLALHMIQTACMCVSSQNKKKEKKNKTVRYPSSFTLHENS